MSDFADPTLPRLSDVLDALKRSDVEPRRQREMESGVRTLAKWLGRPLQEIPASFEYLRRQLERFHPAQVGVQPARYANVRSLAKAAIDAAELPTDRRLYLAPLTEEWAALFVLLDKAGRDWLARPMRFFSVRGIAPSAVDDAAMASYRQALEQESLMRDPRGAHQAACRRWNKAVETMPDWPQQRLTVPHYRETYSLDWSAFPASLKQDVDRFAARLGQDGLLDEGAPPKPLKPRSIEQRCYQLRQFASALVLRGRDPADLRTLADLVDVATIKDGLSFFLDRNGHRPSSMIGGITDTLRIAARYHTRVPPGQLDKIRTLAAKVGARQAGMTEQNRERLAPLRDHATQRRLIALPFAEAARIAKADKGHRLDAARFGVAIALLLLIRAPMRVGNLAVLDLDRHLRWEKDGSLSISVPGSEVKNGQPLEFFLPVEAAALVASYIETYRPRLLDGRTSDALFPSYGPKSKRSDTLSKQVAKLVWDRLGLAVNAHLFRHIAALIIAQQQPGNYEAIRRLLGHKNSDTTYRTYEGEETASSSRAYAKLLGEMRTDNLVDTPRRGRRTPFPRRRQPKRVPR